MRIINCINALHLGDCIQTLHFLINAAEKNNVAFNFICNPAYHQQLQELLVNHVDKIKLTNFVNPGEECIETWVAGYGNYDKINEESIKINGYLDQATSFLIHWNHVSDIMKIDCPFTTKIDLIYNQSVLAEECKHNKKYDYLFINSNSLSMWYENFNEESANFLQKLKARNKTVITTKKIEDYPCTLDYNLSVVEIGKLAKNVKNVVSVNTGPLHLTMNRWSLDVINTFTIWSPKETFGYNEKFKRVKSLGELNESNI
jgi:hypothetical protein